MPIQRRNLLLSALPLSAALFLEAGLLPAIAEPGTDEPAFDQDTYDFWTSQVGQPSQVFAEHGRFASHRGLALPNEADFLFYSTETGFVHAASTDSDTPVSKTLLEKGDASLLLSVDTVRPSDAHMQKILSQKNGSLRIDLKQAVPLQELSETLNWSAIASLFPGEQPYSSFHEITFDPKSTWGQAKKVPLSGGLGFWSWNFSTTQKASIWTQVMGMINGNVTTPPAASSSGTKTSSGTSSSGKKALSTIMGLGLPSVAKTALDAFNGLFGSMLAKGGAKNEWIIHNADTPLLATQDARQKHPGHAVALRSGSYLVLEAEQTPLLLSGKYQLRDGVVVPADTKDADLDAAAKTTLPEVSYIALSTVVQPI